MPLHIARRLSGLVLSGGGTAVSVYGVSDGVAFGSRYLLGEVIGRGAMGRVFRASVRSTGAPVAVKVLRDDLASQPDVVARFVQERQVLRSVAHPNVVTVHDLVVEGDQLGIVMDLVEGGDLRTGVRFPVPADEALSMAGQIAAGLAAVHATGVIHRDLKPENVLVDRSRGQVVLRLTDFGVSRLVGQTLTKVTSLIGTPGYLAPEVAAGQRATAKADVYSLGVLFFEMLTGRAPFEAENIMALLRAHADAPVPRPIGMPDDLWELLVGMLAKTPEDRLPTDEILERIDTLIVSVGAIGPFEVVNQTETAVRSQTTGQDGKASAATLMRTTPSEFAVASQHEVQTQRIDRSGVGMTAGSSLNRKNGGGASLVATVCVIALLVVGLVIAWQVSKSDSADRGSASSAQTTGSTVSKTTSAPTTTSEEAVTSLAVTSPPVTSPPVTPPPVTPDLAAPTNISLSNDFLANQDCQAKPTWDCIVVVRWRDNSAAEDGYWMSGDFESPLPAIPGVGGQGDMSFFINTNSLGRRFCFVFWAYHGDVQGVSSPTICFLISPEYVLVQG